MSDIFNLPAIFLARGEAIISSILIAIIHFGCLMSGINGDNKLLNLRCCYNLILGFQLT